MQLADACLACTSEGLGECRVFTIDGEDFRVYRRPGSRLIPLIAPP